MCVIKMRRGYTPKSATSLVFFNSNVPSTKGEDIFSNPGETEEIRRGCVRFIVEYFFSRLYVCAALVANILRYFEFKLQCVLIIERTRTFKSRY